MFAKVLTALILAYAFSPIDLIPDPIPVLGYLDDLILIPLGVVIVLRLIPEHVMADARIKADESRQENKPVSWIGAALVIAVWLAVTYGLVRLLL